MNRSSQSNHLDDVDYRCYLDKLRMQTKSNFYLDISDRYSLTDGH